jgi:hypothetical protein
MQRKIFPLFVAALAFGVLPLIPGRAQSPVPVIIQAATPAPAGAALEPATSASAQPDSKAMLQLLQEMQATNAATIKKQEAALETLDALQKAAEEIKIFSKRG